MPRWRPGRLSEGPPACPTKLGGGHLPLSRRPLLQASVLQSRWQLLPRTHRQLTATEPAASWTPSVPLISDFSKARQTRRVVQAVYHGTWPGRLGGRDYYPSSTETEAHRCHEIHSRVPSQTQDLDPRLAISRNSFSPTLYHDASSRKTSCIEATQSDRFLMFWQAALSMLSGFSLCESASSHFLLEDFPGPIPSPARIRPSSGATIYIYICIYGPALSWPSLLVWGALGMVTETKKIRQDLISVSSSPAQGLAQRCVEGCFQD